MGEESVKGANLGVILIIFASVLALGLIVFTLARNMANTGLTNITEKIQAAEDSEFSDFDGTIVVGQRVTAALEGYKGHKVAVLIATQSLIDKTVTPPAGVGGAGIDITAYGKGANGMSTGILDKTSAIEGHEGMHFAYALVPGRLDGNQVDRNPSTRKGMASRSTSYEEKQLVFVQYNALLEVTEPNGVVKSSPASNDRSSAIWWDDGNYVFDGAFRQGSGRVLFDNISANLSKVGYTEYIPRSARFNANLLKDSNGVIIGVVFQQVVSD